MEEEDGMGLGRSATAAASVLTCYRPLLTSGHCRKAETDELQGGPEHADIANGMCARENKC